MVWGLGGRNARQVDGCRESEVSRECLTGDTVYWLWNGFNTLKEPLAEGIQRGRAAGPLVKMVLYYKTHLAGADEWSESHSLHVSGPILSTRENRYDAAVSPWPV